MAKRVHKQTVYRDKKGRFCSAKKYFRMDRRTGYPVKKKGYTKSRITYVKEYKQAPSVKIRAPKKLVQRRASYARKQTVQTQKKLERIGYDIDVIDRVKEYSSVGKRVRGDIASYLKRKNYPVIVKGYKEKWDSRARGIRMIVYNARIKSYQEILNITRKQAQALYRIVEDPLHPQHKKIIEKLYGKKR